MEHIFNTLGSVNWSVAANTYGSFHSTIIGLLSQWWVSLMPKEHRVMESGPTFGHGTRNNPCGKCDAAFCQGNTAVGILEVEAARVLYTIEKIGSFFSSQLDDLNTLKFAILALYPSIPTGRGDRRVAPSVPDEQAQNALKELSCDHKDKTIIVVALNKVYEREVEGIRSRNDYYRCRLDRVDAYCYRRGDLSAQTQLWPRDSHPANE